MSIEEVQCKKKSCKYTKSLLRKWDSWTFYVKVRAKNLETNADFTKKETVRLLKNFWGTEIPRIVYVSAKDCYRYYFCKITIILIDSFVNLQKNVTLQILIL